MSDKLSTERDEALRKPAWLRKKFYLDTAKVDTVIGDLKLETICKEASCPNRAECWHAGTATFLILGKNCTRKCTFCNVDSAPPMPVNDNEPAELVEAVKRLNLNYTVITSVNRDDLPDGGSSHFVKVIEALKKEVSSTKIEVLIPDFNGKEEDILRVVDAEPDVLNHNIETIEPFYYYVRPQANYENSLNLFGIVKKRNPDMLTKSGIMVGLGETKEQLKQTILDLYNAGVDLLTIGQYLSPSKNHLPVDEYVHPDIFEEYRQYALSLGFKGAVSGPFVRSSYRADQMFFLAKK